MLTNGLSEIASATLITGQLLNILRNHLISKLMHVLVLAMGPRQFLVDMDRLVRASVTSWCGIPRHTALGLVYCGISGGGLSVPTLAEVVPLLQRDRLQSLIRSTEDDEVLAAVIETEQYKKLVAIVKSLWFIVKRCSDSKLTWIFRICMLFSPKSPNFITLGQGVHENGLSYTGHCKNEF